MATNKFFGLSVEARRAIEKLYRNHAQNFLSNEEWGDRATEIACKYGMTLEKVEAYYEKYALTRALEPGTAVTIFVRDADWLANKPCVDSRYGSQILPHGVWVIGFFRSGQYILSVPYLATDEQKQNLRQVIAEALLLAGDIETDAEELMLQNS